MDLWVSVSSEAREGQLIEATQDFINSFSSVVIYYNNKSPLAAANLHNL
jgi:hypothetical protein